jgi:hypothetical protein
MITRRFLLQSAAATAAYSAQGFLAAQAENAPGVTHTEIKIGQTSPYSGPASAYGVFGRTHAAYFKMINEMGGINGRKINLISLDDGYSPPKTLEQTRRLVEQEQVAFIFGSLCVGPTGVAREKAARSRAEGGSQARARAKRRGSRLQCQEPSRSGAPMGRASRDGLRPVRRWLESARSEAGAHGRRK